MPGACRRDRCSRDEAVACRGRRIAVFRHFAGGHGFDRNQERKQHAASQPLGNGDAIVGDVADAFGMRAVAMRRKREELAIAAAVCKERAGGRRGRIEARRLRTRKIKRNCDRVGL